MKTRFVSFVAMAITALALAAPDIADARRGGSFGSRGARTYSAAPATRTMPDQMGPIDRSMTSRSQYGSPYGARTPAPARTQVPAPRPAGGMFGGQMLQGLVVGGLIGALLGHGFGGGMSGGGAMFGGLLQILLIAGVAFLAWRLISSMRRGRPAFAGAGGREVDFSSMDKSSYSYQPQASQPAPSGYVPSTPAAVEPGDEIGLTQQDLDAFERLLAEVQAAFGAEDYSGLRARTTPEVMSYLSEELSQNATQGLRNEVKDVKLVQADIAEAWREGDVEYATTAFAYDSIDVMRDRSTGAVKSGDPDNVTRAKELWTFSRAPGEDWKLSAIQG